MHPEHENHLPVEIAQDQAASLESSATVSKNLAAVLLLLGDSLSPYSHEYIRTPPINYFWLHITSDSGYTPLLDGREASFYASAFERTYFQPPLLC